MDFSDTSDRNTHPLRHDGAGRPVPDKVAIVRCHTLPQHETIQLRVNLGKVSNGKLFFVSVTCAKTYTNLSRVLEMRLFLLSSTALGVCCGY